MAHSFKHDVEVDKILIYKIELHGFALSLSVSEKFVECADDRSKNRSFHFRSLVDAITYMFCLIVHFSLTLFVVLFRNHHNWFRLLLPHAALELHTVTVSNLSTAVQQFRRFVMSSDICVTCLFLLAIAFNSDSNCNGKYVENRSPDLFPIRKLARSSITWESSDQPVSEFNENLKYLIDGDSSTFWRGPALMNGNEYQEVNLTFHFDQVNIESFVAI